MTIVEDAPAKINLALHVRHRRADGYHALETLFAFARDGDRITVTPAEQDSFAIDGPFAAGLASEGDNLVTRARDRFRAQVAPVPPVAITLTKALPIASGIGGGSADAAATLRALARLADVSVEALMPVACALGADVPAERGALHRRRHVGADGDRVAVRGRDVRADGLVAACGADVTAAERERLGGGGRCGAVHGGLLVQGDEGRRSGEGEVLVSVGVSTTLALFLE